MFFRKERVIAYAAKSLSKTERNYSTTRKELLALVWGLEHFEPYLWGRHFTVRTDHNALRWLRNFKNPKGQVARWLERLSEFNFTVEYRTGQRHGNADGMSRIPNDNANDMEQSQITLNVNSTVNSSNQQSWKCNLPNIRRGQRDDPALNPVILWVKKGERPSRKEIADADPVTCSLWSQFSRLKIVDGLLYREFESEDGKCKIVQLIIPKVMTEEIMKALHDLPSAGHLGVNKMTDKVRQRYYWKGWREDIEDHCRRCTKCAEHNSARKKAKAPLMTSTTGYPMERVALDVIGPLPKTIGGNRFILVICDYFTKWPEAYAVPDHKASTVASKLVDEWVSRYGVMQTLHSDQGRDFESEIFQSLMRLLGIHKTRTTPYHPQSDGLVERLNRTLKNMLSKLVNENQDNWDSLIPQILMAYRTSTQSSTGVTPYRMMFGREARLPVDLMVDGDPPSEQRQMPNDYVMTQKLKLDQAFKLARKNTRAAMQRYRDYYNANTTENTLQVGDRVWRQSQVKKKGRSSKLSPKWEGPYVIIKKITDVVFRLKRKNSRKRVVVHFNSLKKCLTVDEKRESERKKITTQSATENDRVIPEERHHAPLRDDESDDEWIIESSSNNDISEDPPNNIPEESCSPPNTNSQTIPLRESYSSVLQRSISSPSTSSQDAPVVNRQMERPIRTRRPPAWSKDYIC